MNQPYPQLRENILLARTDLLAKCPHCALRQLESALKQPGAKLVRHRLLAAHDLINQGFHRTAIEMLDFAVADLNAHDKTVMHGTLTLVCVVAIIVIGTIVAFSLNR